MIAELEKNHVNYILLSNRAFAREEQGLGFLGTTYCPLIGKYIKENFYPLARFGDWSDEPGWAWNHGTLILKRKGHSIITNLSVGGSVLMPDTRRSSELMLRSGR